MTNDVNWFAPCKKSIKTSEKEGLFSSKNTLFYVTIIFIWIILIVIERGIILVKCFSRALFCPSSHKLYK